MTQPWTPAVPPGDAAAEVSDVRIPATTPAVNTGNVATKWLPGAVAAQHRWWDGAAAHDAELLGWWDGSSVRAVTVVGYWDGSAVQPVGPG